MSYMGRKKHTQALLMSLHEKNKNEATGVETAATEQLAATSESKKSKSESKEWLPAYLSDDRHEANELVAMVQSRRKDDGTFFTGS